MEDSAGDLVLTGPVLTGLVLTGPVLTRLVLTGGSGSRLVVGSLSSVSTWSPVQTVTDQTSADILIPVNPADPDPGTGPVLCNRTGNLRYFPWRLVLSVSLLFLQ